MELISHANFHNSRDFQKYWTPLYSGQIACGLFGITEDFVESYLSLDEKFTKNKESCFFVRASGDSMEPKIFNNDILIADCSIKPVSGAIVAAFFNSNPICKQLIVTKNSLALHSFSSKYSDIIITEDDEFQVFGTVIGLARDFR